MRTRLPFRDEPRKLKSVDLDESCIPRRFTKVSVKNVPDDLAFKEPFMKYFRKLPGILKEGIGLILVGPYSHGKTSLAACCMKRTIAWGGSAYFAPAASLVSIVIKDPDFDSDFTEREWIEWVDLLVIDDLGSEAVSEGASACLEQVVRNRANNLRSTIITSNLGIDRLKKRYPSILAALKGLCLPLQIKGKNWREEEDKDLRRRLEWD